MRLWICVYVDVECIRVNGMVCVCVSRCLMGTFQLPHKSAVLTFSDLVTFIPVGFFYEIQPSDYSASKNEAHCLVWLSNEQFMFVINQ